VPISSIIKSFTHAGSSRLAQFVDGKRVALVGNARSLFGKKLGADIDGYDTIIRLNRGRVVDPAQQGSRTTVIGTSRAISDDEVNAKIQAQAVVWLTSKRWKIPDWSTATWAKTDVMPLRLWHRLYRQLGYRPTSGLIMLYLIQQRLRPVELSLFGFDFYASENFYSGMLKENTIHSPSAEKEVFESIIAGNASYHLR
jgi:hypothetical protein